MRDGAVPGVDGFELHMHMAKHITPGRRGWTTAMLVLLTLAAGAAVAAERPVRPNILFILTDDQSYRTVGAYAGADPGVSTPQIDRLAAGGVRFAQAYVGTWCMPARASLLTGRLPHAVESLRMEGPYPGATYDPRRAPFWPRVLREHGYTTAHIGKWHTGDDTGAGREWDYQASWSRPPPKYEGANDGYYLNQEISFDGRPAEPVDGYSTDNYTAWANAYLRGEHRPADRPWFLWLCYTAPHAPYVPAERHRGRHDGMPVARPADIYPPRPGKPAYMQEIREYVEGPDGEPRYRTEKGQPLAEGVRQYHDVVAALDEGVGRLLRTLEETGQLENTLVIFASDQGFAWGQHGFQKKVAPYDANLRSPLIISQPGSVSAGGVVEAPVGGIDLVPTILSAAGVEVPWALHGRSLWPLLRDPSAVWTHPVLLTYTGWTFGSDTAAIPPDGSDGHSRATGVPWYVLLRDEGYKYIRTLVAGETEELYDLRTDPEELHNLVSRPDQAGRLAELRARAVEELRRTEAPFVDALPPVLSTGGIQLEPRL